MRLSTGTPNIFLCRLKQKLSPLSIRAPRGNQITCKGWQQEAAMRMLMNNLDEEVAERPQDLVVYGGTGKAARNWDATTPSSNVKGT